MGRSGGAPADRPSGRRSRARTPALSIVEGAARARRDRSLDSLLELGHELGASRDPFAIGTLVLMSAIGHFTARRAAVWGIPEDGARAVRLAGVGLGHGEATPDDPGFVLRAEVEAYGRTVGAIAIGPPARGRYDARDGEFLSAMARMTGVALDNARLHLEAAESARRLLRANERLRETDRLKDEFLANVNHEMRTPLTAIHGFLDALEGRPNLDLFQRHAVEAMIRQTRRLRALVTDLLEYAALAAGTARVACAPTDLGPPLARWADERRPGVLAGLRTLEVEIAPDLPTANADAARLAQALDALADNAIKFTPPGTRITLAARVLERDGARWAAVELRDDGPGVPADVLPAVFEAFRQGDGSATRAVGGVGLGLALVHALVTAMAGRLEAESAPGRGATFRLLLPIA